jgi:hypothetical protein
MDRELEGNESQQEATPCVNDRRNGRAIEIAR